MDFLSCGCVLCQSGAISDADSDAVASVQIMRNHGGNAAKLLRARAKGDATWDEKIAELVAAGAGGNTAATVKTAPQSDYERLVAPMLDVPKSAPPRHVRSSLSAGSPGPVVTDIKPAAVEDENSEFNEESTVVRSPSPAH